MAIGSFVEGAPADGGEGYSGRVTPFVVLSCVVAGSGGVLFGYDLGISGSSRSRGYSRSLLGCNISIRDLVVHQPVSFMRVESLGEKSYHSNL